MGQQSTMKWSVTEHPSVGGVDTFLEARVSLPLRKRVKVGSVQAHRPSCEVVLLPCRWSSVIRWFQASIYLCFVPLAECDWIGSFRA